MLSQSTTLSLHPISEVKQTDLLVLLEVVEQNHFQHQLLSSNDEGWEVQRQEEVLEDCELQDDHKENCQKAERI